MGAEFRFKTLSDVEVSGRTVGVRVDFNSPVDPVTKKLLDTSRIRAHAETTLKELVERRAKVVVISHQGRKGDPDFTSLREHAEKLAEMLPAPVKFVDDIFGEKAVASIQALGEGEVLVLENVRYWDGETKSASPEQHFKSELVKRLGPLFDVYVVDAFSAAHRPHASLVGFAPVVKHYVAGRVMEKELKALYRVRNNPERPCVYILGGAKAEDTADVLESVLGENIADTVLTGGLVANLLLHSRGFRLGDPNVAVLRDKGFLELEPRLRSILDKFGDRIVLPEDLAVDEGGRKELDLQSLLTQNLIKDIGSKTIEKYARIIKDAKTIVMNGPMGVFEESEFSAGTRGVFEAIASSKAFSLIGGGHTIAAASKLGYADKVSHVSTGGGALIEYLTKGTLPVVEVLKQYGR
uniref:Phosphoglycerate kinase n=1 Tax=Thermofilum pendens TaxID=2269 RepID=A0A7C4FEK1_THEPE